MKTFEQYMEEALRVKDEKYSPIIEDARDVIGNPSLEFKRKLLNARKGTSNRLKKLYETGWEGEGTDNLITQIMYSPVQREYGSYDDYGDYKVLFIFICENDLEKLYANINNVGRGVKLEVNEDALDEYIDTCEHELTHHIQHKFALDIYKKWKYSAEVCNEFEADDGSTKKLAAMLVYYLFNDIEWEAHQTKAAHKGAEEELENLKSYYEVVTQAILFYQELHNKKYYWPKKYYYLNDIIDDTPSVHEIPENERESYIADTEETVPYIAKILASHYNKPEDKNEDKWVNLFIRECSRRYFKFVRHFRKNMAIYQNK